MAKRPANLVINFFKEGVSFRLMQQQQLKQWIGSVVKKKYSGGEINYIFCSDKFLLDLNKKYLQHNTLTDIITFNNSSNKSTPGADIFISYERVVSNSKKYNTSVRDELHRVMVHGVLHLLGYKDKSTAQSTQMRQMEDKMLAERKFITS